MEVGFSRSSPYTIETGIMGFAEWNSDQVRFCMWRSMSYMQLNMN